MTDRRLRLCTDLSERVLFLLAVLGWLLFIVSPLLVANTNLFLLGWKLAEWMHQP